MNPADLDAYLARQVPVVPAPAYSPFEPLQTTGHRIVVGRNGTFLELRREWLYARLCIGGNAGVTLPFGEVSEVCELTHAVPERLFKQFKAQAKAAYPNETAAWIVYHAQHGYRLLSVTEHSASSGHVRFQRPVLDNNDEHLVIDLHSHGPHSAFFSEVDDQDDFGSVQVSAVIGNVAEDTPMWVLRLCMLGVFCAWPNFATYLLKDPHEN